jgi:hypothetical protein
MVCISGGEDGKHPHSPGCRPYLSRAKRLDAVALVVEISAKSQRIPLETRAEMIHELKPHVRLEDAREALRSVDEMADAVSAMTPLQPG